MEAVIYRRVSSKRQSDEGKSLVDQDSELLDYCKAMRWKVIGNFQDAMSGRREKTGKRKGLSAAVALACEHQATLVVYDLDRLARSQSVGMKIVEQLRDCGAGLVVKSLGIDTNTPAGEMILGIMFAVAQWGSRAIGEGVKRANRATLREKGYRTQGAQPYGWRIDNGTLAKIPEEQEALRVMKRLRRQGHGYERIAEYLNDRGMTTRNGCAWLAPGVHRVLRSQERLEKQRS